MSTTLQSPPPLHTQAFINFETLLHRVLQRSYGALMQLVDQSEQVDSQRKRALLDWFAQTRADLIRTLVLLKWARTVPDMSHCTEIVSFLQGQDADLQQAADMLYVVREKMEAARAPIFDVPTAIDVLSTGSYIRLPTCIQNIVPPSPVESEDEKVVLSKLSNMIHLRLFNTPLPPQFNSVKISDGRLILRVNAEFELVLTVEGEAAKFPWKVLAIDVLVDCGGNASASDNSISILGNGSLELSSAEHRTSMLPKQLEYLCDLVQKRIAEAASPLEEAYTVLHSFCVSMQLESLLLQATQLTKEKRWADHIKVQYTKDTAITVQYWLGVSTAATASPSASSPQQSHAASASAPTASLHPHHRAPASVTPVPSAAAPDVHNVQIIVDEQQSLSIQQNPKLPAARLPKVDPRNLNMEEILLRSLNLHAQSKLTQLQEALLADESLGMLPEHIAVTVQPGPPEVAVHTLQISLGVDRQLSVRVNSRTGKFSLKLPPMSAARGDRIVPTSASANLSSAALTQMHQQQAEDLLNNSKENSAAAIRRIVLLQKHQAVIETFLSLSMMLYPSTLEPLRSIPLEGKTFNSPELYLRFLDATSFFVQIEIDSNFQPQFHLLCTQAVLDPNGSTVFTLSEPPLSLSANMSSTDSASSDFSIDAEDSGSSTISKNGKRIAIDSSKTQKKQKMGNGALSAAGTPSASALPSQQKKQLVDFGVYRQQLIHVVETTRRSKINRLLLMRAFDSRGIRCRGSANDKMELVGLSAYGVDVLQPAHANVQLSASGWEVRIVESARVLRKIKFLNSTSSPENLSGSGVRYHSGQWSFDSDRFDSAAVDLFVAQLRSLTLLVKLCVKLEKLIEHPNFQQLFVSVFKVQSLTTEALSIQYELPDAPQQILIRSNLMTSSASGTPAAMTSTSPLASAIGTSTSLLGSASSMSSSILGSSGVATGPTPSASGGVASYSLLISPMTHPAARLFATMLHSTENELGRLFEAIHCSMRPCHVVQTLQRSLPPAEILVIPRGVSQLRMIFRSTYAVDLHFRSAHAVVLEDAYNSASKTAELKLQPITQLANLMDRISKSGVSMEKTRALEFAIGHPDLASVLQTISRFVGSLYLLRKIPFLLFEIDPANKVSPPDLTKLMMRFQMRTNYQISISLVDFARLELHINMFITSANPTAAAESLTAEETEILSQFFRNKVTAEPFRVAAVCSFLTLLYCPFALLRDFIHKILAYERDGSMMAAVRLELLVPPHSQIWNPPATSGNLSGSSSYPHPGTPALLHDKPNSEICLLFRVEDTSRGSACIPLRFAYATNRVSLWQPNRSDEKPLELTPTGEKTALAEAVKLMREQPEKIHQTFALGN